MKICIDVQLYKDLLGIKEEELDKLEDFRNDYLEISSEVSFSDFVRYIGKRINGEKVSIFANKKIKNLYEKYSNLLRYLYQKNRIDEIAFNKYEFIKRYVYDHKDEIQKIYGTLCVFSNLNVKEIIYNDKMMDKEVCQFVINCNEFNGLYSIEGFYTDGEKKELFKCNTVYGNVFQYDVYNPNYIIEYSRGFDNPSKKDGIDNVFVKNFDFDLSTLPTYEELTSNNLPDIDYNKFYENSKNVDNPKLKIMKR